MPKIFIRSWVLSYEGARHSVDITSFLEINELDEMNPNGSGVRSNPYKLLAKIEVVLTLKRYLKFRSFVRFPKAWLDS